MYTCTKVTLFEGSWSFNLGPVSKRSHVGSCAKRSRFGVESSSSSSASPAVTSSSLRETTRSSVLVTRLRGLVTLAGVVTRLAAVVAGPDLFLGAVTWHVTKLLAIVALLGRLVGAIAGDVTTFLAHKAQKIPLGGTVSRKVALLITVEALVLLELGGRIVSWKLTKND